MHVAKTTTPPARKTAAAMSVNRADRLTTGPHLVHRNAPFAWVERLRDGLSYVDRLRRLIPCAPQSQPSARTRAPGRRPLHPRDPPSPAA